MIVTVGSRRPLGLDEKRKNTEIRRKESFAFECESATTRKKHTWPTIYMYKRNEIGATGHTT
jgi:hypothetical protein